MDNWKILEELIETSNKMYSREGAARVDKISTPVRLNPNRPGLAHYSKKSTVDFTGLMDGGQFIAFDAKYSKAKRFPLSNIKPHQIDYLQEVNRLGGLGFILIEMAHHCQFYIIAIDEAYSEAVGAKKSLTIKDIERLGYEVSLSGGRVFDYLYTVKKILDNRL